MGRFYSRRTYRGYRTERAIEHIALRRAVDESTLGEEEKKKWLGQLKKFTRRQRNMHPQRFATFVSDLKRKLAEL